jgi:IS605 OrfB family transposase
LLYQQGSGLPREIVLLLRLSDEDQEKTFKRFSEDWRVKRVLLTKNLRDRWVVKFVYEVPKKERQEANNVMGVDLGIVKFLVADTFPPSSHPLIIDGIDIIGRWRAFKERQRQLQRLASLTTDGSGRAKIRRLMRKQKGKMAAWRHDLLHQITRRVVDWAKQNAVKMIALEDLTGIREDIPFLSVFPYYKFFNVLQLKAQAEGIEVVRVDPYRTSKTCHLCGQDGETDDERVFHCKNPECGWHGDRDLNAARYIARRYLESQSREIEVPKYLKRKRERKRKR